jgi:hypothetical protein
MRETVARDSKGRIRIGAHINLTPQGLERMKKFDVTGEKLESQAWPPGSVASIFDCNAGTVLRLQIEMQLANLRKLGNENLGNPDGAGFPAPFLPGPGAQIPPNMSVEPLGNREIQGLSAVGLKATSLGTEKDGEWSAKPISETELWASEDLSLQLIKITRDFRSGTQSKYEVTSISRIEPDAALFEIPADYKMDPAKLESFEVRPGIIFTVTLGADQHDCQMHFEATESFIHRAMNQYMNSDTVTEVLEEIAPAATRGKPMPSGSFQASCGAMQLMEYENVSILIGMSACTHSSLYRDADVSVFFKRAACPRHDSPFSVTSK